MDSGFAPMAFGFVMVAWVFCGSVIGFAVCRVLLVLWWLVTGLLIAGFGFVYWWVRGLDALICCFVVSGFVLLVGLNDLVYLFVRLWVCLMWVGVSWLLGCVWLIVCLL